MARKMVLVPSDMYQSMIASSESLSDTARVMSAKREADKVLRSRGVRTGAKRVLYDKRMRDFLKLRREAFDKPLRVKMVDQPPQTPAPAPSSIPVPPPQRSKVPPKRKKKPRKSREMATSTADLDEEPAADEIPVIESDQPGTSSGTTSRHEQMQRQKAQREHEMRHRLGQLLSYVQANREKFGITEDNQIRTSRTHVTGDVKDSLIRIIAPNPSDPGSPAGTKTLRSRLMKDDGAREIIKAAGQIGKGIPTPRTGFKPALWRKF